MRSVLDGEINLDCVANFDKRAKANGEKQCEIKYLHTIPSVISSLYDVCVMSSLTNLHQSENSAANNPENSEQASE